MSTFLAELAAALGDDLNVSSALAALFGFVRDVNGAIDAKELGAGDAARVLEGLERADVALGVIFMPWGGDASPGDDAEIEALVEARNAARRERNFAESDRIRDELAGRGIVLEDGAQGTRWKRK